MAIERDIKLDALFTGAKTAFELGKPTTPSDYEKIATIVNSDTESETYAWLGKFPKLKEWVGARVLENMKAHGYTIKNKTYEDSVAVSKDDIDDDKFSIYKPLFVEAGREAAIYPNEHIFTLLKDGVKNVCYDGQYFFDTDHPVGKGVASNISTPENPDDAKEAWFLLDATSSLKPLIFQVREKPDIKLLKYREEEYNELVYGIKARSSAGYGFWQRARMSTKELTADNLKAEISAMKALKDDNGRPLGIKPNLLVVGPNLEWIAEDILNTQFTTSMNGTKNNIMYKKLELLTSQWLG